MTMSVIRKPEPLSSRRPQKKSIYKIVFERMFCYKTSFFYGVKWLVSPVAAQWWLIWLDGKLLMPCYKTGYTVLVFFSWVYYFSDVKNKVKAQAAGARTGKADF